MIAGYLLHQRHQQHVMVDSEVALLEDGCELKLVGRYLVVARLHRNGQLQSLYLKVFHEGLHTIGNGAEIVVVHLLVLCTLVSHQRATCHQQVGTRGVKTLVDKEILLFPTQIHLHFRYIIVEQRAHVGCCFVYGMQRTQQRCLIV